MAGKKDLVGSAFSDLLINKKFDYIFKGVPPHVLVMKVAHEITQRTGDDDFENVYAKAKELIEIELKKETLVVVDGNYSAGPKTGKNDDNSNDMDQEGADEYEDEEDDEDDEDSKRGEDDDYSPTYFSGVRLPQRRGEGRVSARQKKSRFDSEDYVYPNKLKNFMKRTSPGSSPNKSKVPRKRPGPKPRNRQPPTTCSICRNPKAEEEIAVTCRSCPVRAHKSCSAKELKGKLATEWACFHCTPRPNAKWKCAVCGIGPGKDLGVLVSCESCASQYHKQCHSPPIPETRKLLNSWRCSNCPLVQGSKSPVTAKRLPETSASTSGARRPSEASVSADDSVELEGSPSQKPDSEPAHKKFLNGSLCFKCKREFPNSNDKATCSNCKLSFHARCCRAKEVANLTRLGSRKSKWRCDACKFQKGRGIPVSAAMKSTFKKEEEVSDDEPVPADVDAGVEDGAKSSDTEDAWWKSRLRPIPIGPKQPPLGPIPDLRVPDIAPWTALQVQEYFDDFFEDPKIGTVFVEHDIDGKALKLMRRNDIISTFQAAGYELDVILDVILHIKRLQLRVNDRRYIWADTM